MDITSDIIVRYQPGGDIYAQLEAQYGRNAALLIAQAAQTGDRTALNEAIAQVRHGAKLNDSTARIFWAQVTTDPFDAPLDSLNKGIGTIVSSALKGTFSNPWVLLLTIAIGIGAFFFLREHVKA